MVGHCDTGIITRYSSILFSLRIKRLCLNTTFSIHPDIESRIVTIIIFDFLIHLLFSQVGVIISGRGIRNGFVLGLIRGLTDRCVMNTTIGINPGVVLLIFRSG